MSLLRKGWWLIGLSVVACVVGAGFYTMGLTKIYQAEATLQIDPTPPKPLGGAVQNVVDVGSGSFWNTREYYNTQYEILRGRTIAQSVVRRLGLQRDASFILNKPSAAEIPEGFVPDENGAWRAVRARIEVVPLKDSRLMTVIFRDADPERARQILSTLVEIYLDQNVDSVLESTTVASQWLGVHMEKLREELGERELKLHEFKKDNRILSVSMDDQNNMLRDEMRQLNHELTRVRASIEEISSRYDQLAQIDVEDPVNLPAQELLDSALLQRLRSEYVEAKKDLASLLERGKGVNHPNALAAASTVELSKTALLAEVANIKEALRRRLTAKNAEASGLSDLFQRAKTRALELNRLGLKYQQLERDKDNTEKVFSLVLERSKESDLTRHMRFNNIRLIDEAITKPGAVEPRVSLNLAIGGFFGLCLGFVIALGRSLLDRTFRGTQDVEQTLGLTLLGTLPKTASPSSASPASRKRRRAVLDGNELIVHEKPNSNAAEAARALRTSLMFTDPDQKRRSLLVTSGGPADGKTTVACWIACALAQTNKRVLLLDCDLRRPRVHKAFGRTNEAGLTTLLLDDSHLDDWDLSTQVPNLHVISAGPSAPNPAELLQSERFEDLLAKLCGKYDQVVIDSPPIAAVTDATVLSTKVDGVILVVRAHSTPRDLASQGARTLRGVKNNNLLGCVLNDLDASRSSYGYGGYYHRYQYYYGRDED